MPAQIDQAFMKACGRRTFVRLASYALFEGRPVTTRGQVINTLVLNHLRLVSRTGPSRPVTKPIFLVGMGRSGTTLLGTILATHPAIGFLNEPKAIWHTVVPYEDVGGFYAQGNAKFRLGPEDASTEVIRRTKQVFGYYAWLTRSCRIVDKYPELTYRRSFLRAIFPDAIIIGIVRHPDAVVSSVVNWTAQHGNQNTGWWGVRSRKWHLLWEELIQPVPHRAAAFRALDPLTATPEQRALAEWIVATDELTRADAEDSEKVNAIVRYEDLVAQPAQTIRTIARTAELPECNRMTDFAMKKIRPDKGPIRGTLDHGALAGEADRLVRLLGYEA